MKLTAIASLIALSACATSAHAEFDKMQAVEKGSKAFGFQSKSGGVKLYGTLNLHLGKRPDGFKMREHGYGDASSIGVKGWEDLGNGYAAIFNLEGTLNADTGTGAYQKNGTSFGFNQAAYVGVVTPVGALRFGTSGSPLATLIFGHGYATGKGRGTGVMTGSMPGGGVDNNHQELASIWKNAAFYDAAVGSVGFGVAVTTKGNQWEGVAGDPKLPAVDNEGVKGTKPSYGGYATFTKDFGPVNYRLGAAYQSQNGTYFPSSAKLKNANGEAHSGYTVVSQLKYGPVTVAGAFNRNKIDNTDVPNIASATIGGFPSDPIRSGNTSSRMINVGVDLTSNDYMYVMYGQYKRKQNMEFIPSADPLAGALNGGNSIKGLQVINADQLSLGYEHRLSKRTTLYTNVSRIRAKQSCTLDPITNVAATTIVYGLACDAAKKEVDKKFAGEAGWSYDVGLSHSF